MAQKDALLRMGVEGLAAGLVATSAMSAFMEAWARTQPAEQREPIPPRVVARTIAGRAGAWTAMPGPVQEAYVWLSHYGYGTAMSLAYTALEQRIPGNEVLKGTAFGVGVWAAGYAGWLPGLGLLQPPTRKPVSRIALVLGAHLVWGASLGLASRLLGRHFAGERGGEHQAEAATHSLPRTAARS